MIFLDANAFYSYYGRNKLRMTSVPVDEIKLRNYISTKEYVSLPTSVYIEIISHFRDDSNIIIDIIKFIVENDIKLYNNIPFYTIKPDEIHYVQLMREIDISQYAKRLLDEKINIESKFVVCFFEIISSLYAKYRIDFIKEFSDTTRNAIFKFIGDENLKEYTVALEETIKQALIDGYAKHAEQKSLKDIYIDELKQACFFIDVVICIATESNKKDSDLIKLLGQKYAEIKESSNNADNGTMRNIVETFLKDSTFLEYAKERISKMFRKYGYSKNQTTYLKDVMFSAWFERGQKLQKNDIFDMFCLGCLDFVGETKGKSILELDYYTSYILSFDDRMKKYIETHLPNNSKIIEDLQS